MTRKEAKLKIIDLVKAMSLDETIETLNFVTGQIWTVEDETIILEHPHEEEE